MRKLSLTLGLCLAVGLVLAHPAIAQDDGEDPPTLRISMFQCHWDQVGAIVEELETRTVPIWDELVDEGMVMSAGTFIHAWADEWNVGIYTVAPSIQAVLDFNEEAARRYDERYPDAEDVFGPACPKHRDNFYGMGPRTGQNDDEGEGN
jgi:hypothetical protein